MNPPPSAEAVNRSILIASIPTKYEVRPAHGKQTSWPTSLASSPDARWLWMRGKPRGDSNNSDPQGRIGQGGCLSRCWDRFLVAFRHLFYLCFALTVFSLSSSRKRKRMKNSPEIPHSAENGRPGLREWMGDAPPSCKFLAHGSDIPSPRKITLYSGLQA